MKTQLLQFGILVMVGFSFSVHAEKGNRKPSDASKAAPSESGSGAPGSAGTAVPPREELGADYVTEKRQDGSTVKYKKKTTYDFEGSNIDGIFNKPSGSYISNIKDVKGRSIIRIRENFDAEVIDSSRQLK